MAKLTVFALTLLVAWPVLAQPAAPAQQAEIVINGRALNDQEMQTVQQLAARYNTQPIPGRYWYDHMSGLYGYEGQGTLGQLPPNLPIGDPVKPNASNGTAPFYVNGRQLTWAEVQYLSTCMQVIPGRYWMDSQGIGGVEGGPAIFNVTRACAQARGGSHRGKYGSVLSDGTTSGAFFKNTDGSYTGVTCGPDGGCIYN